MRPIKHLNTKYLFNRFKVYVYSKKYKNAPWLTPDMIRFLDFAWSQK